MNRLPSADELPYRFVAPRPSRFWNRVMGVYRNRLIGGYHRVAEMAFEEVDRLRDLLRDDARVLLAPNHTDHADGLTVFRLAEEVDMPFCYMATHELFQGSFGLRYKIFPRCGIFPIDREGATIAALKAARDVLVKMKNPLVVYPEGEIYHTNDRLTPLRDGTAAMALTAQKALKEKHPVYIVPVALKYRYLDPKRALGGLRDQLTRLEGRFAWRSHPEEPLPVRLYRFASGLLALKEVEFLGQPGRGPVPLRMARLRDTLLERQEEKHFGARVEGELPERFSVVRRRVLDLFRSEQVTERERASYRRDLDELFVVIQLFSYPGDYVQESPTVERIAETLIKLEQDLAGGGYVQPVGERRLTFRIGEPLEVRKYMVGKSREAASACTRVLAERLQGALDDLGEGTLVAGLGS